MALALEKTLSIALFLFLGFLIRRKFANQEQVNGIKNMILTIALPATIFVALLGVEIKLTMLVYPLIALVFNFLLYALTPIVLKIFAINSQSAEARSIKLLFPSLAPGLSCFPFILEFLGEEELAIAALADIGNKFFVLIFLYLIALNIFMRITGNQEEVRGRSKLKSLLISMAKEPINLVILLALALLTFGVQLDALPAFLSTTLGRMGGMMTPLVLLFIGIAVKVQKKKLINMLGLLATRAGVTLLISGLLIMIFGLDDSSLILLAVVFPLSSCSFWPFAHMAAFNAKQDSASKKSDRAFDLDYAVLLLACSLPFSTLLILGVLASGSLFVDTTIIFLLSIFLILIGTLPALLRRAKVSLKLKMSESRMPKPYLKRAEQ